MPISNLSTDLVPTLSGFKCKFTGCTPECVMVLARVAGESQETQIGEGEDAMVEIVHDEVFSTGTDDEAVKFRVEFLVPVVHRDACLMQRGQDYVIVGRPECAGDSWTLIAEKIHSCGSVANAPMLFKAEVKGVRDILKLRIAQEASKHPAHYLIDETPTKVLCVRDAS